MDINATLFGQMITFAVFVWFTMKYVWPPLQAMLKARKLKIAEGLTAAERGHKELEIAQKTAIKEIREGREQAQHILDMARKQAISIVEEAKHEANQEREKILNLGKAEIEHQTRMAEKALKSQVTALVIDSTEKLLRRAMNDDDQKILLDIEKARFNDDGQKVLHDNQKAQFND